MGQEVTEKQSLCKTCYKLSEFRGSCYFATLVRGMNRPDFHLSSLLFTKVDWTQNRHKAYHILISTSETTEQISQLQQYLLHTYIYIHTYIHTYIHIYLLTYSHTPWYRILF